MTAYEIATLACRIAMIDALAERSYCSPREYVGTAVSLLEYTEAEQLKRMPKEPTDGPRKEHDA